MESGWEHHAAARMKNNRINICGMRFAARFLLTCKFVKGILKTAQVWYI